MAEKLGICLSVFGKKTPVLSWLQRREKMVYVGSSEGFLEEEALLDLAGCEEAPWHGCLTLPL